MQLNFLRRIWRDYRGVAAVEFALVSPLFVGVGLLGLEYSNLAMSNIRVGQIARLAADNVARVRTTIDEAQINETLYGALQTGEQMNFAKNGRLIISSVERNSKNSGYWIRWQRCAGKGKFVPKYGTGATAKSNGTGYADSSLQQIGDPAHPLIPPTGNATIFVEVGAQYQPLISAALIGGPRVIRIEAASVVRQRTDFSVTNLNNQTVSSC